MDRQQVIVEPVSALPGDLAWLRRQPCPVIAYGDKRQCAGADIVVPDLAQAQVVVQRVQQSPLASLALVQVLRAGEGLPASTALDIESFAYATLQAGPEFAAWKSQQPSSQSLPGQPGEPIRLTREGAILKAVLNRAALRNSVTVEMRDALVEVLELLAADDAIEALQLSADGACFSVGGELTEFGTTPDPATAHWVRTVQSPARLLAQLSDRVRCHLHGACIGSGIELPAFASHITAHHKTFFQLPELQFGLIPGAGGTVSIARRIGRHRTAWLVLTGKRINAKTALEWGLIDAIADV